MEFKEGQTVGIDLGTTFSSIAQLDDQGTPVSIPNDDDEVETPSLVVLVEGGHVLVGPSRKSFIGNVLDLPVEERLEGTAAAVAISVMNGADIVRVHDVKEMVRVVKLTSAVAGV